MSGRPKNLLFLLADQFRHDMLGCAGGMARTPHLDALAARGALFTRAYTPLPVCAPARQALLCGRHPDAYGAFWNGGMLPASEFAPEATFTQRLADAGVRGGYVGKWDASRARGPQAFGFDWVAGADEHKRLMDDKYPGLAFPGGWMGCESPVALEDSATHFLARRALSYVDAHKARRAGAGFFLWVDFGVPHLPCRPSAPFSGMYAPRDIPPWPAYDDPFIGKPYCHRQQTLNWSLEDTPWADMARQVARYMGMVSQLDDAVGLLLGGLKAAGVLEDTLVVFTSDHGDMCGNHRMFDKHYVMYDDIVRVPLIMAGPGINPRISGALVSNCLDMPVTLCDMFGLLPLPGAHGMPLPFEDGAALRSHITSSGNGQQFGMFNTRMITDGHRKYVWNLTDTDEFYDLDADPAECVNRIADPALRDTVTAMRALLYDDLSAHGDPFANAWLAPQLLEGRKA